MSILVEPVNQRRLVSGGLLVMIGRLQLVNEGLAADMKPLYVDASAAT